MFLTGPEVPSPLENKSTSRGKITKIFYENLSNKIMMVVRNNTIILANTIRDEW